MVFILVPWYLYWCYRIYIGAMVFLLVQWYLYWCHGIYNSAMIFIFVPCSLYWCHVIYIGAMVFILVLLYFYWHLFSLEYLMRQTRPNPNPPHTCSIHTKCFAHAGAPGSGWLSSVELQGTRMHAVTSGTLSPSPTPAHFPEPGPALTESRAVRTVRAPSAGTPSPHLFQALSTPYTATAHCGPSRAPPPRQTLLVRVMPSPLYEHCTQQKLSMVSSNFLASPTRAANLCRVRQGPPSQGMTLREALL